MARRGPRWAGGLTVLNQEGINVTNQSFIRWLDERLVQDADFATRMQAALRALRMERLAAAITAVRARHRAERESTTR
jgi:hypothetical protein